MKIIHSDQSIPDVLGPSIFLAGPTPRLEKPVPSWRPDAIQLLLTAGFEGTVLVPEYSSFSPLRSYDEQVEWEWKGLHNASVIAFWVPRNLDTLPGFTTNYEFGFYISKRPIVYGRPAGSHKNRYGDWLYNKVLGKTPYLTLEDTMLAAMKLCGSGEPSCGNG